jgi:hypothetical protein
MLTTGLKYETGEKKFRIVNLEIRGEKAQKQSKKVNKKYPGNVFRLFHVQNRSFLG